jgi:hypothetical protein
MHLGAQDANWADQAPQRKLYPVLDHKANAYYFEFANDLRK